MHGGGIAVEYAVDAFFVAVLTIPALPGAWMWKAMREMLHGTAFIASTLAWNLILATGVDYAFIRRR